MLNKKNYLIIKVEGSFKNGLGHVYRINNLLKILNKKNKIIVFTKKNEFAYKFFKRKLGVYGYSGNEYINFKKLFKIKKPKYVIFDELNINYNILNFLKKENINSIFLDCKNVKPSKKFFCVDTFIQRKNIPYNKNYYYGYKYLIIDQSLYKKNIVKSKNILLHFGGTDRYNILKTIYNYNLFEKNENYFIVIGPKNKPTSKIINKISRLKNIKIFRNPKKISQIYSNINFAIVTGGITLFNIASLRIPNISISTNKLEQKNCRYLHIKGYTKYFGPKNKLNSKKFINFYKKNKKFRPLNKKPLFFKGLQTIEKITNFN